MRKNPFCVISKAVYGANEVHDIQLNNAWKQNPYGKEYAVVPDILVRSIVNTRGYCDIELNSEGTEVEAFTARTIPEAEEIPAEPTQLDRIEAQVTYTAMMTDTLLEV